MPETTYTYSVASDTANGSVASGALFEEIEATAIVIALDDVKVEADVLDIVFKDALSTGDKTLLDGAVSAHDGVETEEPPQAVKIQETAMAERQLKLQGVRFEADLNAVTTHDISWAEDRELQGVDCHVENHTSGDYLELEIHHPLAGLISQFTTTVYVPPNGRITPPPSYDTSTIPAGLIIRFEYTSVGTTGDKPVIICHLRTHV